MEMLREMKPTRNLIDLYEEDIFYNHEKEISTFPNMIHVHPVHRFNGTLALTNFRIIFVSKLNEGIHKFEIPLGLVGNVEISSHSSDLSSEAVTVFIDCKDTSSFKFISQPKTNSGREFYELVNKLAFPLVNDTISLWAFYLDDKYSFNGWEVYVPARELGRLGIPNDIWLPVEISDSKLKSSAKFRTCGCFPTLSWIHPRTQATISRSGQPQMGPSGQRCVEDEETMQAILDANTQSHYIHIFDARSQNTASAQTAKGGGFESPEYYPSCQLSFLSTPNIHLVRESFKKLKTALSPPLEECSFLSRLDKSQWLSYVSQFLEGALKLAMVVEHSRQSVVVHSSDSGDRNPLLTSLAMLMLDPFYRTLHGFEVLIEKEWLYFGSNFAVRHGHGMPVYSDSRRSYNFVLFMDCVWQILCQFPNVFQFNETFLLDITKHSFSAHFGTFIFNSESAMVFAEAKIRTVSLWSYFNSRLDSYRNPLYLDECCPTVIFPTVSSIKLKFWRNMYLKNNMALLYTNEMLAVRNKELLEFELSIAGQG
ncbi:myotubularin-related protein 2-like [Octopus sinensis]|uniref:Myotubularin-related protein 2-like n=1 Tax=Octopus sinensis TaxID=2607531 RepID=A0A7E6EHI9_9MOLL|nr:myotubularin-related protein 2-like [Octopus sinensis]